MRRAVFFDLQGTLGGDPLGNALEFKLYPFAPEAIRLINEAGMAAVVLTNQSGIAKGRLTYAQFEQRMFALREELALQGARLDAVYCCPHSGADGCACRKPQTELLHRAVRELGVHLGASYVVGDMGATDIVLARNGGCRAVLVRTGVGEGSLREYRHLWADIEPDFIAQDVLAAAHWITADVDTPVVAFSIPPVVDG
jgi:D-glycero-D-manno-heptose 1,7-bisphosphate phosphatase